jgi:lipooligosaccharide transport system permease protein
MSTSNVLIHPPYIARIYSVWFRHMRVYTRNLVSNGLPPFLEPLIFLAGVGLGLGAYVDRMQGVSYLQFLATGLLVTTAMFTAAFECSYGTFIRLEFEKVYDGMLGASLNANDLIIGEMIWAGTKGLFFTSAVMLVVSVFGILPLGSMVWTPLVGFVTGLMFAALSLLVTSWVKSINHFSFYFTGFLSPMFFFSGVVFPLDKLPSFVQPLAELVPLTHSVRLARSLTLYRLDSASIWDLAYIVLFVLVFGYYAAARLKRRLIL